MSKKILIVEDEPAMRKALAEKFRSEGFDVSLAVDGVDGIEQSRRIHPDIILLDLVMPKMDGMTMLKQVRELNDWGKNVPVIILTNLPSEDENIIKKIVELTPTYYLVKADWKINDIVEKVKERAEV